jgi:hypothetical protein
MKTKLILFTLLFWVVSCDSPQRSRLPSTYVSGVEQTDTSTGGFVPDNLSDSTTSGSTSGSGSGSQNQAGFENCDLSQKYHTIDIGYFGLCQNSKDETVFKFKPSLTSTGVRTCLIPTWFDSSSNGSSTYIGQPQCTYTTSNQTVTGQLVKNRSGFENYQLNGVIVMKEPLLPEYFNCMQGYVNWPRNICPSGASNTYCAYWLPRCPQGVQSNAACSGEGQNYMASVCNQFKQKYSNSYISIKLK